MKARWRVGGKQYGNVFQFFQLLPSLSILENCNWQWILVEKYHLRKERSCSGFIGLVGLKDHAFKLPSALSGGKNAVAIARALARSACAY